jgi:hypothetical protein
VPKHPKDKTTIIHLEVPWTTFKTGGDSALTTSEFPYLEAIAANNSHVEVLHRQITSADDLSYWLSETNNAPLGYTVAWVSAHGIPVDARKKNPDYAIQTLRGPNITAAQLRKALAGSSVHGLVVGACCFAQNAPKTFLPGDGNLKWALAFDKDIEWTYSILFLMFVFQWLCVWDQKVGTKKVGVPKSGKSAREKFLWGLTGDHSRKLDDRVNLSELARRLGTHFITEHRGGVWKALDLTEE